MPHQGGFVHGDFAREQRLPGVELRRDARSLPRRQIDARMPDDAARKRQRFVQHAVARKHGQQRIAARQFRAGDLAPGEQAVARQVETQPGRQDAGGTRAGREPEIHVRADVAAFFAEQHGVAEQAEGPAGTDAVALHRGDDRQRAAHRQLEDIQIGEADLAFLDRFQAVAGAAGGEIGVVAGEHDRLVPRRRRDAVEHFLQAGDHRVGEHVPRVAIFEAHQHHAVGIDAGVDHGRGQAQRARFHRDVGRLIGGAVTREILQRLQQRVAGSGRCGGRSETAIELTGQMFFQQPQRVRGFVGQMGAERLHRRRDAFARHYRRTPAGGLQFAAADRALAGRQQRCQRRAEARGEPIELRRLDEDRAVFRHCETVILIFDRDDRIAGAGEPETGAQRLPRQHRQGRRGKRRQRLQQRARAIGVERRVSALQEDAFVAFDQQRLERRQLARMRQRPIQRIDESGLQRVRRGLQTQRDNAVATIAQHDRCAGVMPAIGRTAVRIGARGQREHRLVQRGRRCSCRRFGCRDLFG